MEQELIDHWNTNADRFNMYIRTHQQLQVSSDYLKPFIKPFEEANDTLIGNCQDCLIDMLIWVRSQLPKETKTEEDATNS